MAWGAAEGLLSTIIRCYRRRRRVVSTRNLYWHYSIHTESRRKNAMVVVFLCGWCVRWVRFECVKCKKSKIALRSMVAKYNRDDLMHDMPNEY